MGGCLTLDREDIKARRRSVQIDRQLAELSIQEKCIVKIILLGSGESGKSTLVKQMKIIHNDGFTKDELLSFRPTILDNLLSSMKYVLVGMGKLRINLQLPSNKKHAQALLLFEYLVDKNLFVTSTIKTALETLWQDRGVRLAVARGYEYQLNDSALYLFENMSRLCEFDFVPTATDVLRARVRTNGIIETHIKVTDNIIRLYDVGGQRSQRKKWIYCFDDVKAVLFVVSLSGYDMSLVEDPNVNRLEESLNLFSQIVNNRFFKDAAIVLFLNKYDLFREKILYSKRHLRYYFPDYKGPDEDVDRGALFIQHKFLLKNRDSSRRVYPHFITATDTSNVQYVFQSVIELILSHNTYHLPLL